MMLVSKAPGRDIDYPWDTDSCASTKALIFRHPKAKGLPQLENEAELNASISLET